MSEFSDLCTAIVSQINAADLPLEVTAERVHIPLYDLKSTTGLKVFVLGLGETIQDFNRGQIDHEYTVKVAIYKRVDPKVIATIDAMDALREAVQNLFTSNRRPSGFAVLTAIKCDPVYDPAQLEKFSTYVSVLELTYSSLQ